MTVCEMIEGKCDTIGTSGPAVYRWYTEGVILTFHKVCKIICSHCKIWNWNPKLNRLSESEYKDSGESFFSFFLTHRITHQQIVNKWTIWWVSKTKKPAKSTICRLLIQFDIHSRGAGGSRTLVQTYSSKAFYMLISALLVGKRQEQN